MPTVDYLHKRIDSLLEQVEQQREQHDSLYGGYKQLLAFRLERRLAYQDGEPIEDFLARFNAACARVCKGVI